MRGAVILVPDFALSRGKRRVYLELAGYWRPGYRERKARKLAALRDRGDLALAAPVDARAEFAALEGQIPTIWYEHAPRAQALLDLLDHAFNDWTERVARLDSTIVRARVAEAGCLPPAETAALLRSYTRDELAHLVAMVARVAESTPSDGAAPRWIDGVGLCAPAWLEARLEGLRAFVAMTPDQDVALSDLRAWLAAEVPAPEEMTEAVAEAMARMAGLAVHRDSLFAARVSLPAAWLAASTPTSESTLPASNARSEAHPQPHSKSAQPRPRARRKDVRILYTTESLFSSEE